MNLQEGKVYTLTIMRKPDKIYIPTKERWRLIKCYRHHALFENRFGTRQSFKYPELKKMLERRTEK